MFVAFDGIDGCGKTKQSDLFKAYCEKAGLTVTINRDPGGTPAGSKIRSILLDKSTPLTPEGQTLLFMAARAELCHLIQQQEKQNEVVISDRWLLSTLAYQCYLQSVDRQFVLDLYREVVSRSPDIYVVIDIDPAVALARKEGKPAPLGACEAPAHKNRRSEAPGRRTGDHEQEFASQDDRFESMGVAGQEKIRQGYLTEVDRLQKKLSPLFKTHFILIDGNYSPDVLAQMIRDAIAKLGPSYHKMMTKSAAA